MLLPSEQEAILVGDIVLYLGDALEILGECPDDKAINARDYYAIRYAAQCAIEACIRLDGSKKTAGRFEQLFPGFKLLELKTIANRGRHDYGGDDPSFFIDDLRTILTELYAAAIDLRTAKIRSLS